VKRAIALLLFAASPAIAQAPTCTNKIQGLTAKQVTAVICPGTTAPAEAQPMIIGVGNSQFETTANKVTLVPVFGFTVVDASVKDPVKAQENLILLSGATTATLTYQTTTTTVSVIPADPLAAKNRMYYEWAVGPARAPNVNPATPATSAQDLNAVRFTALGDYAIGGVFGKGTSKQSRLQSTATIKIDSTDKDSPDFTDDNRAAAGIGFTNLSLGRLWMHGNAGFEAHLDKGFHGGARNADAVLTISGWVPVARSFTLFRTQGEFIAAPLSFTASYGYRNRRQPDGRASGRFFEGSALYHLFLFDDYQVSFSGKWTVNDMSGSASVPHTQKLFKVTVAYMVDNKRGFQAVASFENGAAGAMLKDVRNYFIGVALSKLNLGGKGGGGS